ncbi:hypothetical protein BGZ72_010412 [Mortierella alpina]|nr:hypothetical protein BGZ72_010412 [Mortierella alpina]
MNTARPSSRNQQAANGTGIASTAAPPRRAKVASAAQMDISMAYPSKPLSIVGSSTTNPPLRPTIASSASFSSNNSNNNSSSNYGYPAVNSNNNASGGYNTPPRIGTVRVRSSNSVVTTASFRNTGSPSSAVGAGPGRRDTGSVTSDDGTVSEDSDRAADDGQLYSGGHSISGSSNVGVSVPFGTMGRQTSATGSIYSTAGPKIATGGRQRTASSTVGVSNNGNSSTVGSIATTPAARPVRIAAGASMSSSQSYLGVSSAPGSNAGSVIGTSSPNLTSSTSSHLGVGNSSNNSSRMGPTVSTRNGDDTGSVISMSSAISTSTNIQQQPVTIRSAKSVSSRQAEETRRAEEAAKRTRRKVEDLEISNASLLQVNKTLEATIRKQAAEMAELKLRASSAHYGDLGYTAADLALAQSVEAIELTETERQDDLMFKRMCLNIEQMIYEAKHALDQSTKPTGVKVLSLYDMYEKEVTEDAEEGEDDDTEEGNRSFIQNKGKDEIGISIEVLQLEDDDGDDGDDDTAPLTKGQQRSNQDLSHGPVGDETEQDGGKNALSLSPPNMISSANVAERPLTMVT